MSKILCTLAFYHDGGTLKPQLVLSCNPVTNLVVKGSDWKGARFSNTNATLGARHRFEYSFTGGKSVTRMSLVMNTSAILPPLMWLSKHPVGAPTKTGPRGKKEWKQTTQKARDEKRLEGIKEVKRIEGRESPSRSHHNHHQHLLDDHPYSPRRDEESRRHHLEKENRSNDSQYEEPRDRTKSLEGGYPHHPDQETRRRHRHRRLEGSSSSSSSSDSPQHTYRRSKRQRRWDNNAGDYYQDDGDGGGDAYPGGDT